MRRTSLTTIAAACLLTGCASSAPTASPETPATTAPATTASARNPVDILRQIPGCKLDDGVTVGQHDADGNRYATCNYMDNDGSLGTDVTVYTGAGQRPDMTNFQTDDSHKVINGPDWFLVITGNWGSDGYSRHVKAQDVAAALGGTFVAP